MIPGLHLLLIDQTGGTPYYAFLSKITPFWVWYLLLLSFGVRVLTDLSRHKSEFLVVLVWLADAGFRVVISAF